MHPRVASLVRALSLFAAILAIINFLAALYVVSEYVIYLDVEDVIEILPWFSLPLAVLLVAASVYLMERALSVLSTAPSSPGSFAEASLAETETVPAGTSVEELKKYEEYLAKLEELRRLGQVSEAAYQALMKEYMARIEELRRQSSHKGS
jgi:hypothetical protein